MNFPTTENFMSNNSNIEFYHFIKNNEGKYLNANQAYLNAIGLNNLNDLLGLNDYDLCWNRKDTMQNYLHDKKVMASRTEEVFIEYGTTRDGSRICAKSYKYPLSLHSKKILGVIGTCIILPNVISNNKNLTSNLSLTQRQLDCLLFLVKGFTMKQIAKKLSLSPKTIENYLENIKNKLNCNTRSELFKIAFNLPYILNHLNDD